MYCCTVKNATNTRQLHSAVFSDVNGQQLSLYFGCGWFDAKQISECVRCSCSWRKMYRAVLSQHLLKDFQRAFIFPLQSCSSLSSQRQRLQDELLGSIINKDKIFRDCLSATAGSCEMTFPVRMFSVDKAKPSLQVPTVAAGWAHEEALRWDFELGCSEPLASHTLLQGS